MPYFLKLLGIAPKEPLPVRWWEERKEIVDGVFFSREPKSMSVGSTLIYYSVVKGCICGVATIIGAPTQGFKTPPTWTPERRQRFSWRLPVKLDHKCAADKDAPRFRDFHDKRVPAGSFMRLNDAEATAMIDAIKNRGQHVEG